MMSDWYIILLWFWSLLPFTFWTRLKNLRVCFFNFTFVVVTHTTFGWWMIYNTFIFYWNNNVFLPENSTAWFLLSVSGVTYFSYRLYPLSFKMIMLQYVSKRLTSSNVHYSIANDTWCFKYHIFPVNFWFSLLSESWHVRFSKN